MFFTTYIEFLICILVILLDLELLFIFDLELQFVLLLDLYCILGDLNIYLFLFYFLRK